ncbi:MAG: type 4a pilus biogenesis protein PilO [Dokdonella sp.]|uniref:type 4a pilus biogenesis protein PilO n=1 Tax=Dokdonella sp. TaxID=2291710 RepID=UPI0025BE6C6A|nr:type 4a pilus biogenesis protein PilO [Dokdonella sp.]MBZ0223512.1 type 4a pilus biogenesis protein PilO [Dokdonella sp.]MCC7255145.1 type 4a pilus biogenesis protein PilO [Dokdonella sp.]
MSFLDDLRNLDRNNIGGWSAGVKAFFAILIVVVILFLGWWFKIRAQQEELETARAQEITLQREFATDQAKVVNLEPYRKQLADMQEMLQTMLRQLPSKTEMPELLNNITQAALSAGIETELFQPGAEVMKDFYAEKPIQLRMLGTYHQFGTFISNVASLPRVVILTMHDVSLKPASGADAKKAGASGLLILEGTVKTYRYLDDEEAAAVQAAKNPQKGKTPPPAQPKKGGA